MSITATTASAAVGANDVTIAVTSSTGATANLPMKIDNEYMYVVSIPSTTSVVVRSRGAEGTAAVAHDLLANVQFAGAAGDFPSIPAGSDSPIPPFTPPVVTYGQSGAIAIPVQNTNVIIDKASAAAMTIAAPSKGADGITLVITSQTAAAHTVTGVALLADAVTGSPHSTGTYAAFKGATMTIMADQGLWNVVSSTGVTVA